MTTPLHRAPKVCVDVREDIIATAIRRRSGHCMISNSVRACVKDAEYISTDLQTIRWTNRKKRERYIYFTPPVAQHALLKFDQGNADIKPFKFTLYNGQIVTMKVGKQVKRTRKRLIPSDNPTHPNQLQVTGGSPPPLGPLASGAGTGKKLSARYLNRNRDITDESLKIGQRRSFGLRAIPE